MVKIFVGNLSPNTTTDELRSLFSQYGKISECDIVKNFGFVHMDDKAEAEEAIRNLHHYMLNGLAMNVEMSRGKPKASTKLHVGNISSSCTNQELRAKFEEYGPVVECDIVKDYAFVHMERVEDAMEAISGLDNTAFQGKLMSVKLSTSRLRTAPGMGERTGCYRCGQEGHWSKECPLDQNGSYREGSEGYGPPRFSGGSGGGGGRGGHGYPSGPGFGRGTSYETTYASSGAGYGSAVPGYPIRRAPYDERDPYGVVDYYEKYRARPYGGGYFEDRRAVPVPAPPPPASSTIARDRLSSSNLDPYERRPIPPTPTPISSYYTRDRSPIRRLPVEAEGYSYDRSRISPVPSINRSSAYDMARDPYGDRARYAF
uniref:RNA binding motif protein 4.1 n=1 Tax=Astyanax mexicanus TaxID=7994 RepID=A0A3B1IF07_ASTMX